MYLEGIEFKRTKESEWERGYYIGETDNADKSIILDMNFEPVTKNEDGTNIWDFRTDICNRLELRINND